MCVCVCLFFHDLNVFPMIFGCFCHDFGGLLMRGRVVF